MALQHCVPAELEAISAWYRLELQAAGRVVTLEQAHQELRRLEASGQIEIEVKPTALLVWRRLPAPQRGEQLVLRLERPGAGE